MYKTILLPTDGSPISRKAVKQGIAFAKAIGAKVVGFYSPQDYRTAMYGEYVPPAFYVSQAEFEAAAKEAAQKQLAWIERAAADVGVRYEGVYKVSYAPWEAIIETAKKKKCDLIFMGSHGRRGLAGVVLGSQTTKVLTHSKIPVLVAR
jgi:nucleotide-binding universal stress UspA family protein